MAELPRKLAFTFPFAALTALATHAVRFGDDHAFGGEANSAIVAAAIGGSIVAAISILSIFLSAGSTTVTGSVASSRVRALLPNAGLVFAFAAICYYSIELLEGNGVELGLPTLVLALFALLVRGALSTGCDGLAQFVDTLMRDLVALLAVGSPILATCIGRRPRAASILLTARRFGRAPPNERRFR